MVLRENRNVGGAKPCAEGGVKLWAVLRVELGRGGAVGGAYLRPDGWTGLARN